MATRITVKVRSDPLMYFAGIKNISVNFKFISLAKYCPMTSKLIGFCLNYNSIQNSAWLVYICGLWSNSKIWKIFCFWPISTPKYLAIISFFIKTVNINLFSRLVVSYHMQKSTTPHKSRTSTNSGTCFQETLWHGTYLLVFWWMLCTACTSFDPPLLYETDPRSVESPPNLLPNWMFFNQGFLKSFYH